MVDAEKLRPATVEEIAQTLAYALQFDGRKSVNTAVSLMAQITAVRLVSQLERAGFVVMKKPPSGAPTTASFHLD